MTAIVRFAPSPTGYIHIGNLRVVLFNWLLAQKSQGQFVLRFDDTDKARSEQKYADAILEDLAWLSVVPDRIAYQSHRSDRYDALAEKLKAEGLLYACYETADELDRKRKRQRARGLPPVYDRTGYFLTDEEKTEKEAQGRRPHWRFLLPNFQSDPRSPEKTDVVWDDLCRGQQSVDLSSMSDPVLIREDGSYLYTLPSIIDDIDMEITHVVRGEDHVANTGVQISIFKALGGNVPIFAHHNLLVGGDGAGLSKRNESLSLRGLREEGFEPLAVAALSALIGTSNPVEPISALSDLVETFDFGKISRAPARFEPSDLATLNAKTLHALPYSAVAERLKGLDADGGEALWDIARENLEKLSDIRTWVGIMGGHVQPIIETEDREFINQARALLPPEPWSEQTWKDWTDRVKTQSGRKGRGLFMPLRKALTGMEHGPELKRLLPLIGRQNSLDRLS
ncbi:MAG: glutamate--tRNA ligase [Stappiaceae bacterium]